MEMFSIENRRRFADLVEKDKSGCWVWIGPCHPKGYGEFCANGQKIYAHRYIYEYLNGPLMAGLELDHTCNNKSCVNPDHLEAVIHAENMRRAAERGVWTGERNGNAKRTEKQVRLIKMLYGLGISVKHIVERFGIPKRSVYAILAGECWSHVRI
jgi:hypothetical protein